MTQNRIQYQAFLKMPEPNKKGNSALTTGFGRFYGQTSYGAQYTNLHDKNYIDAMNEDRERTKKAKERHQKGSLSPIRKLPFIGKWTKVKKDNWNKA